MKSNPLHILRTLDDYLVHPFSLYIYGRSALALGFPDAPAGYHATMDVDAILPAGDILAIDANEDFWQAQAKTNETLDSAGLYFTHLFEDRQVILTSDWLKKVVILEISGLKHLRLWRPSTEDLILTKMMRIDPQDREDIEFLLRQKDCSVAVLHESLDQAQIPPVTEIEDAFVANREWLLTCIEKIGNN